MKGGADMYIIGNPIKSKDDVEIISAREFMKIYTSKLTKGLIKNIDESANSHLYYVWADKNLSVTCRF